MEKETELQKEIAACHGIGLSLSEAVKSLKSLGFSIDDIKDNIFNTYEEYNKGKIRKMPIYIFFQLVVLIPAFYWIYTYACLAIAGELSYPQLLFWAFISLLVAVSYVSLQKIFVVLNILMALLLAVLFGGTLFVMIFLEPSLYSYGLFLPVIVIIFLSSLGALVCMIAVFRKLKFVKK